MNEYKVAICIPNYNMEKTLESTILSALDQTYKNVEIYILDNCSSDNSMSIINKYSSRFENIIVLKNEYHLSMAENWNKLLRSVKNCDFINILSADDILEKEYVEECISLYKRSNKPLSYIYADRYNIINGERINIDFFRNETKVVDRDEAFLLNILGFHTAPCQLLINFKKLEEVGFLSTKFGPASDMHLTLKLNSLGPIGYIRKRLIGYNISSGMTSNNRMLKYMSVLFYDLKTNIIDNNIPNSLKKFKDELKLDVECFCSKYCIKSGFADYKNGGELLNFKEVVLLAGTYDKKIIDSELFDYVIVKKETNINMIESLVDKAFSHQSSIKNYI